ncbi:hypothetical protein BACUNI_04516 [Bacteroides uniformis ATCC 8492]|uniref:Transposase n=1 Tax=Bacteroides uniformis (strain ATCC 8492 / DSM 6597 / CCUG 4942 / CIP 103695 / JCM 5828 / KCTC 5204 / NCTC 13054 / VPI 0061) TaxID=411479 RepID=A0ABC9N5I0_BACUC|nr:hypothetical protein BACUNI_04516 [Bacteroides uniformis ATCC 8492]
MIAKDSQSFFVPFYLERNETFLETLQITACAYYN